MRFLKQSTTVTVQLGPALDRTDGVSEEMGLSPTVEVSKAGAAFAARNSATAIAHDQNGWYRVELNATDTNTLGALVAKFDDAATHLPVWHEFAVLAANVYDSLIGASDKLQVDVAEWLGSAPNALISGRIEANAQVVGDKTAYALTTADKNDIADRIWDEATSGHVAAGSFGQGLQLLRTGTAQGGAAGSITLDASASSSDDFYNNTIVQLVGGTGAGQSRIVSDYTGSTKVATVNGNWVVNPDATSVFVLHAFGAVPGASAPTAAQVADAVWDEAMTDHVSTGSTGKTLQTRVTGGAGALQRTIGITVAGSPLEGASVWVATDAGGANIVAGPLTTSSLGAVTVLLDAGAYYVWAQKDGYDAIVSQAITLS